MKKNLLYLVHRIPFPPNKGDKIRSFHWLKGLSTHYNIYLGCFIDDPADEVYLDVVKEYCAETFVLRLNPLISKIRSVQGILSGRALSLPYYSSFRMQKWVSETIEKNSIESALVFSSPMAQFIDKIHHHTINRVMDFVDIDSDKWRQYAESKTGVMRWLYTREAHKLFYFEKQISRSFNKSLFVSQKESEMFRHLTAQYSTKIDYVNNGVDFEYFSPSEDFTNPYQKKEFVLVFTGAMDYWANVDAVSSFVETILPKILKTHPQLKVYIVGSNPTPDVLSLGNNSAVVVTGRVKDVRPYIQFSNAVIAPMRIARGIQNKVLEGMAMAKKCIVSPQGLEGIDAIPDKEILLVNSSDEWIKKINQCIDHTSSDSIGKQARDFVIKNFSWQSNVNKLMDIL